MTQHCTTANIESMSTEGKSDAGGPNRGSMANQDRRGVDSAREADLARLFSTLGDPTRLRILQATCLQDVSPDALALHLQISGNLLAHHLRALQRAGLITRVHSQHDRRRTYIQSMAGLLPWLADLLQEPTDLHPSRVVFVCTHNSARSILAEALWRQVSAVPCTSAGTAPANRVHPRARRAARTLGLPMREHPPQHLDDVLQADDIVVSVCDAVNEELLVLANPRLHWSIADPSAIDTDPAFIHSAGLLRQRVERLAPRLDRPTDRTPDLEAQ